MKPGGVSRQPFSVAAMNLQSHAINHRGRTVAIVTPQGFVDWLLADTDKQGPLLSSIRKETHLGHILGLKFDLFLANPCNVVESVDCEVIDDGATAVISSHSRSSDDAFRGRHRAVLAVNEDTGAYEWSLETTLTCNADAPRRLGEIEYCNILPSGTAGRLLRGCDKAYDRTLMVDRNGVAWEFPHQHLMHYASKTNVLEFANGSVAGFFLDDLNPVVIIDESPFDPTWQICDAYYDLHCCSRTSESLEPGGEHVWKYRILYMDRTQAERLAGQARRVAVTDDDRKAHAYPRVDIGLNTFSDTVAARPRTSGQGTGKDRGRGRQGLLSSRQTFCVSVASNTSYSMGHDTGVHSGCRNHGWLGAGESTGCHCALGMAGLRVGY